MKYTTTLILAVLAIAAVALIIVYKDRLTGEPAAPEKPAETLPLVKDLKADDVTGARVEQAGEDGAMAVRLALKKDGDQWRLTAPVDAPADDYEARRLIRAVAEARAKQMIDPAAPGQADARALGLEPSAFRVTLTAPAAAAPKPGETAAERTIVVDVGRKAAFGEGLYVRVAGEKKAAVLASADLLDRARERIDTYRSRNLVDLTRDQVVRVVVESEKGKITLNKSDEPGDRWVIADPLAARADPETASALLRTALGAMVADFMPGDAKDLAAFGLDKPRLTVTLFKAGEPPREDKPEGEAKPEETKPAKPAPVAAVVLKFGAWADLKKESVYTILGDGAGGVVTVEDDTFKALDKTLADLRDRHVLSLEAGKAARVTVRMPAKLAGTGADVAYDLIKADGAWNVEIEGRKPAKADAAFADALLKELADLKVLYFAEGENAAVAKDFKAAGSVRVQVEGATAEAGFEIGGSGEVMSLVRNLREDWTGRINEKDLDRLKAPALAALDKTVLEVETDRAARLEIKSADRTLVFEKAGDAWKMTAPVAAEPRAGFVTGRLEDLRRMTATKIVAATTDFKAHGLESGQLVVSVTTTPKADDKPKTDEAAKSEDASKTEEKPKAEETPPTAPVTTVLHLARAKDATALGRVEGSDLVFEVPLTLFKDMAGEPLEQKLVSDVTSFDATRLEVVAGETKVVLVKVDEKWFRADAAGRPDAEADKAKVEDILRAATDLKALRWVAYDAKAPAKFGLDKPIVRIEVATEKAKAAILISGEDVAADVAALFDERPLRYAMTEGGERIAILAGGPVDTLMGAAKTLAPAAPKAEEKPAEPKAGTP
jgi:hypothetical protein